MKPGGLCRERGGGRGGCLRWGAGAWWLAPMVAGFGTSPLLFGVIGFDPTHCLPHCPHIRPHRAQAAGASPAGPGGGSQAGPHRRPAKRQARGWSAVLDALKAKVKDLHDQHAAGSGPGPSFAVRGTGWAGADVSGVRVWVDEMCDVGIGRAGGWLGRRFCVGGRGVGCEMWD